MDSQPEATEKVPNFPRMGSKADLVTFLSRFETHMRNYEVEQRRLLIPTLNEAVLEAFNRLQTDKDSPSARILYHTRYL